MRRSEVSQPRSNRPVLHRAIWIIGLMSCTTPPGSPAAPPAVTPAAVQPEMTDDARLIRAIEDAAVPQPGDVRTLISITDDSPEVIWRDPGARRQLLVGSWMARGIADQFYSPVGKRGAAPPAGGPIIWLTVIPELQQACRAWGLSGKPLQRRAAQYLGLRPSTSNDTYVQMWVDRDAVLRPCLDPEPTDDRCDLEPTAEHPTSVTGIEDYRRFFLDLYAASYHTGGAPWTRLGYTYDWAPDSDDRYGVSEFILAPGSGYEVESITPFDEYCRPE